MKQREQNTPVMLYPQANLRERDAEPDGGAPEDAEPDWPAPRRTDARLRIAETFASRQGEGQLTGVPSFFIRTSGCNLRCWFCDTPYASWNPEGSRATIADLVDQACRATLHEHGNNEGSESLPVRHVVVTGGEPLIAPEMGELTSALRDRGLHVTIETAGTVDTEVACDLLSLSPKLSGSTPDASEHPQWAQRHQQRRLPLQTMRNLIARASAVQVKFVLDSVTEFPETLAAIEQLRVAAEDVWIMPQGVTAGQLDAAEQWLKPWTEKQGYHYCDRMQIRWYGNRRGT